MRFTFEIMEVLLNRERDFLQIGVTMISDVVDGSEDETLVVLIVDVFLSLLQDDDRADDEEQQEGNLPDELFLVHIDGIGVMVDVNVG